MAISFSGGGIRKRQVPSVAATVPAGRNIPVTGAVIVHAEFKADQFCHREQFRNDAAFRRRPV